MSLMEREVKLKEIDLLEDNYTRLSHFSLTLPQFAAYRFSGKTKTNLTPPINNSTPSLVFTFCVSSVP